MTYPQYAQAPAPKFPLTAGWICIGIAVGAVILSGPLGFFVAGPLALVSVILAIIGMAKNNTGGGIALLLTSLFAPAIAFLIWLVVIVGMMSVKGGSGSRSGVPAKPSIPSGSTTF